MTRGNRLTSEELEEIRERAEKATEGPWERSEFDYVVPSYQEDGLIGDIEETEDADFIAHAREDIPKLLAEIEYLREGLTSISDGASSVDSTDQLAETAKYYLEGRTD